MSLLKKIVNTYKQSNIVFKAGIWFLCVTIIDKGIAVLTQPIINRILSVEEVGIWGVYNSWKSIFAVLATFNLFGGVLEVYLTKESAKKNQIVASLCSLSMIISLIFWSVFFGVGNFLPRMLGLKKIYIIYMAIAITAEAIIQFWAVPKRFEYSYKAYTILIVSLFFVKSILSVALTYVMKTDRVLGRIVGLTVPTVLVAVILLIYILKKADRKNIEMYWKKGILFNLPLIPHYLSSILLASSDRVMIQQLSGEMEAGLYTVSYSYASLALIIFNALNSTYNPLSMKAIEEKNYDTLKKSTELIVLLSAAFSIFMMLLAPEGLLILGGEKYMSSLDIIPVLILGIYFSAFYFIFSNVEFVYEKNKLIFPITVGGAAINLILNWCFIPIWGYRAAAYTTFIGYLFIAILHYFVSRRIVGMDIYNIKKILIYMVLLLGASICCLILYRIHFIIRYLVLAILGGVLCMLIYKNQKKIFKKNEND